MGNVEVLILHGSPGSGKSTLADAISEYLRETDQPHCILDPDELCRVHPMPDHAFSRRLIKALWPTYSLLGDMKVIIPTVILDCDDLALLQDAIPANKFLICELVAPVDVLKERVSDREPNEYWKDRLRGWVDVYQQRDESKKFGDFEVVTDGKTETVAVQEIVKQTGWGKELGLTQQR